MDPSELWTSGFTETVAPGLTRGEQKEELFH